MKVLVIGGAGYIGSHVVKELNKNGHEVTVFDNLYSGLRQNLFKQNDFIHGDILNTTQLDEAFSRGFDAFIHLAAFKGAGESMVVPEKYSVNNITGTLNILNAATKHNCLNMVFSSSAAVFGSPKYLPIDEDHPKDPENFYGYTKLDIESYMAWYEKLRGLKYASLRYFNAAGYDVDGVLCGLEQNPANLLPVIMEVAAGMRKELKIFGNDYDTPDGTPIRDYIHIMDLAKAHVIAVERMINNKMKNPFEIFNLGTGTGYSVLEVIRSFEKVSGVKLNYEIVGRRAGDIEKVWADPTYSNNELGWKAERELDEMTSSAWRWEQAYREGKSLF